MLQITGLPSQEIEQWRSAEHELNSLLPNNVQSVRSVTALGPIVSGSELAVSTVIKIYFAMLNLMEVEAGTCNTSNATYARNASVVIDQMNIKIDAKLKNEWIIFGRLSEQEQNRVKANLLDSPRLTGLEELIKKENGHVTIFRRNSTLIVLSDKRIRETDFYNILSTHYVLATTESGHKLDIIEDFLKGIRENKLHLINSALQKVITLPAIEKAKTEKYKTIFIPPVKVDIRYYTNLINDITEEMRRLEMRYTEKLKEYDRANAAFEEMKRRNTDIDIADIIKHLETCPYIERFEPSGTSSIVLHYYAPLLCYDEFLAEKKKFGTDKRESEIFDIFIEYGNKYEMWTECKILMNPKNKDVQAHKKSCNYTNRLGHPHLDRHGCRGNHIDYIVKYLKDADYKGAINQISEMVLEFNFADSIVVQNFIDTILNNKGIKAWRNKETGEFLSTEQVLEEIENGKTQTDN